MTQEKHEGVASTTTFGSNLLTSQRPSGAGYRGKGRLSRQGVGGRKQALKGYS